jgi:nucleoside-diphosphate-sugar epimerase
LFKSKEKIVSQHKDHVILRVGTLYGPQFEVFFNMIRLIEKGKIRIIGEGDNRVSFTHVDDVADVFVEAIKRGNGTYVVAGDAITQNQIIEIVCNELNVPIPKHTSKMMALLAIKIKSLISRKKPTITGWHINVLSSDREFDCSRAKKKLEFSPRPLEKGIKDMVKRYRNL